MEETKNYLDSVLLPKLEKELGFELCKENPIKISKNSYTNLPIIKYSGYVNDKLVYFEIEILTKNIINIRFSYFLAPATLTNVDISTDENINNMVERLICKTYPFNNDILNAVPDDKIKNKKDMLTNEVYLERLKKIMLDNGIDEKDVHSVNMYIGDNKEKSNEKIDFENDSIQKIVDLTQDKYNSSLKYAYDNIEEIRKNIEEDNKKDRKKEKQENNVLVFVKGLSLILPIIVIYFLHTLLFGSSFDMGSTVGNIFFIVVYIVIYISGVIGSYNMYIKNYEKLGLLAILIMPIGALFGFVLLFGFVDAIFKAKSEIELGHSVDNMSYREVQNELDRTNLTRKLNNKIK